MLGASGYTGEEVVRLLALHPVFDVTALTGETQAGKVRWLMLVSNSAEQETHWLLSCCPLYAVRAQWLKAVKSFPATSPVSCRRTALWPCLMLRRAGEAAGAAPGQIAAAECPEVCRRSRTCSRTWSLRPTCRGW